MGEIYPLGGMFTPSFTPRVNTLYCLEEWRGEQRISPPGDNFTPGGLIRRWGQSLPLGAKLRMGLNFFFFRPEPVVQKIKTNV
jgi:hypothetical protein